MKEKTKIESLNLAEFNIAKIKEIFPEIVSDGLIDFEKLKLILGEGIEDSNESYRFEWVGKRDCYKLVQTPSMATLNFYEEESLNPDKTENIIIEGDNLEVLKLLQSSYKNKIKMIYVDPPYNTGKDFVYEDDFKTSLENYYEITGQKKDGEKLQSKLVKTGRKHTQWMNMIFPRLILSKSLLNEEGLIFISIDDNELNNLSKICDEVFGEENFVAILPTIMNLKGNNDEFGFAGTHEYTVVYSKNKEKCKLNQFVIKNEDELDLWEEDDLGFFKKGANLQSSGVNGPRNKRPNLYYPIFIDENNSIYVTDDNKPRKDEDETIYPSSKGKDMTWRWEKKRVSKNHEDIIIKKTKDSITLYKKQRPAIGDLPSKKPKSIFYKPEYSSGNGTNEIQKIFGNRVFSNPKPINLMKDLIEIGSSDGDIVLDLFAGSGSLAHGLLDLNKERDQKRKFILIQLPEKCEGEFNHIAEITIERTRRVIEGIHAKPSETNEGFKVFKLEKSNYRVVNEIEKNEESKTEELISSIRKRIQSSLIFDNSLIDDYKELNVVYENLIKEGFSLNSEIKKIQIEKNSLYEVSDDKEKNKLIYVCFEKLHKETIDSKDFTNIGEDTLLICFDIHLTDSDKANLSKTFKIKTM